MKKKISVEIADTPSRREKGLMFRKTLGKNDGMLFKFPHADYLSFWMKNTNVPLDIAFISDDGTIFQISQMNPMSTKHTTSEKACRYALEVNQWWFKKNNIEVGCRLKGLFFKGVKTAQSAQMNQPNQPNQKQPPQEVNINMSNKEKIKYAQDHGLKLRILYVSKDGFYVGPRVLRPVPQENNTYPFFTGPEGEYFKGFDESPTISGGPPPWESRGNTPKSFYVELIQKLDVIDNQGNVVKIIRGQPIEEDEGNTEPNEDEAKMYVKQSIPGLTDAQWNKMKSDVIKEMKGGKDISDIVNDVKLYFMSLFNRFKKR